MIEKTSSVPISQFFSYPRSNFDLSIQWIRNSLCSLLEVSNGQSEASHSQPELATKPAVVNVQLAEITNEPQGGHPIHSVAIVNDKDLFIQAIFTRSAVEFYEV